MCKILVIDDDKIISKVLKRLIKQKLGLEVDTVGSLKELKEKVLENVYDLAICDYILPDSEKGEAIDYLLEHKVPTIALTASYDEQLRDKILEKGVVDYLVKGIPNIQDHIISVVKRALKNKETKVLVIEDSKTDRTIMKRILENMLFQVFEASCLSEAEEILKSQRIKLIILDYYLPEDEDTVKFIYSVRERFPKSELAIIVVSGVIHTKMVPLLLKAGANDFLQKPFGKEEFMVRITNTLELIDLIKELEFYAYRDPLTGLYNRRYFFEEAPKLWNLAKRRNLNLICVMMDIDDFKKINDLYGHEVGDLVLKDFSKKLQKFFQRGEDLLARIGGEEFVLLITFTEKTEILKYLESFREYIAKEPLKGEDFEVSYTISMGVETELKNSLKEMMISADRKLYEAKAKGKNCIVA